MEMLNKKKFDCEITAASFSIIFAELKTKLKKLYIFISSKPSLFVLLMLWLSVV